MLNFHEMKILYKLLVFNCLLTPGIVNSETILLKDGVNITAKVTDHDVKFITILREDNSKEEIEKNRILKIIYKVVKPNDIKTIRKNEILVQEKKRLAALKLEQEKNDRLFEELNHKQLEIQKSKKPSTEAKESSSFLGGLTISNSYYSPENITITLGDYNSKCNLIQEKKQWFLLFGSVPINNVSSDTIFEKNGHYRVYFKSTALDTIASVVLGLVSSITLKSVYVESCESESEILIKKKELEFILNKNKEEAREELLNELEEENKSYRDNIENGKK